MIIGRLAEGATHADILADYPSLVSEDIDEALRYAALAVEQGELPLLASA